MQNLVVDREEDGKAVIQYLKRRDGRPGHHSCPSAPSGRGSCGRDRPVRREPGFVGRGRPADLASSPQYRNVFSNLLGRVAVDGGPGPRPSPAARKYGYTLPHRHPGRAGAEPRRLHDRRLAPAAAPGILSRANELERLNEQRPGPAGATGPGRQGAGGGRTGRPPPPAMRWRRPRASCGSAEDAILKAGGRGGPLRQRGGRPGAPVVVPAGGAGAAEEPLCPDRVGHPAGPGAASRSWRGPPLP